MAKNRLLSLLLGIVLALALEGCLATSRNACRVRSHVYLPRRWRCALRRIFLRVIFGRFN